MSDLQVGLSAIGVCILFLAPFVWHSERTAPRGKTQEEITATWYGREVAADMRQIDDLKAFHKEGADVLRRSRRQAGLCPDCAGDGITQWCSLCRPNKSN